MLKRRTDRDRDLALAEAGIPVWSPGPRGPARIYKNRAHEGAKKAPKCVACFPALARRPARPAGLRRQPRPLQPAPRPALHRLPLRARLPRRHRRALQRPRPDRRPLRRRAAPLRPAVHQPHAAPTPPPGSYAHAKRRQDAEARLGRAAGRSRPGSPSPSPTRRPTSTASACPTHAPSAAGGDNDAGSDRRSSAARPLDGRRPPPPDMAGAAPEHQSVRRPL